MYCHKCGKQISEDASFCMHCGASQNTKHTNSPRKGGRARLGIFVVIILILLMVIASLVSNNSGTENTVEDTLPAETTQPTMPANGWYEEDGKTYYLSNGERSVGYSKIDGAAYYFDQDGVLQKDTLCQNGLAQYVTDAQGKVTQTCLSYYPGSWADKPYKHKLGSTVVLEFKDPPTKCTSFDFYVEATGKAGTKMNRTWQLCAKINGEWQDIKEFEYSGPSTTVTATFDTPVTVEAVTAYIKVRGGYSYTVYYELRNVWMNTD